ncbi:hypothetical protein BBP40_000286 [Aspergillus hancockii]|nr:hypothetical protein BBP40_000286 [Aspergillus hancockii]
MYEGDLNAQAVLRCSRCNKPFEKRKSPRGRDTDTTAGLEGLVLPLGLDLVSPVRERRRAVILGGPNARGPRIQVRNNGPAERRNLEPSVAADPASVEDRQEASSDGDITLDRALVPSDPEFANLAGEYFDWNDPDINFDFWNPPTDDQVVQSPSSGSSSLVHSSTLSTDQVVQVQQGISSPNITLPPIPTYAPQLLIRRPKVKIAAQRTSSLIMHTLKSYLLMMLRHNALPPFIHPRVISSDVENNDMEPLINCISLVRMLSSEVRGNRKLFWKNVRLECERLCEEHLKLNKWELLAAMQALSIYILIKLDEGDTDHNKFDLLLLATVTAIAKQLARSNIACYTPPAPSNSNLGISWKDWIFEESRRRLSVVYRVMNMLVYFEPSTMCNLPTDLILAPLPAKKQLWEAGNEFVWKAESEREPGLQTAFALAANGELIKVDEARFYCIFLQTPRSLENVTLSL